MAQPDAKGVAEAKHQEGSPEKQKEVVGKPATERSAPKAEGAQEEAISEKSEDAQKRAKIDHKMGAEAERTREGLCALGKERVMGALRDLMHASAAPAPPLPQYLASCQRLVGLVTRLRATSDEHERRELAERLLEAARLHVAPEMVVADAPATTLAQRARAQVGDLSALAIRPALMREVEEALAADGE